jgi:hypothetical protein
LHGRPRPLRATSAKPAAQGSRASARLFAGTCQPGEVAAESFAPGCETSVIIAVILGEGGIHLVEPTLGLLHSFDYRERSAALGHTTATGATSSASAGLWPTEKALGFRRSIQASCSWPHMGGLVAASVGSSKSEFRPRQLSALTAVAECVPRKNAPRDIRPRR